MSKCLYCSEPYDPVFVHGHYQCRWCGKNIDESATRGKHAKDNT